MTEAMKRQGESGAVLLQYLEQRIDNVVYRSGFSVSRQGSQTIG